MALVIDSACGESGFGEVDGGKLDHPAGLAGVAVNDGDDSDDFSWRFRDPPLCEEFEASRVSYELGVVSD